MGENKIGKPTLRKALLRGVKAIPNKNADWRGGGGGALHSREVHRAIG